MNFGQKNMTLYYICVTLVLTSSWTSPKEDNLSCPLLPLSQCKRLAGKTGLAWNMTSRKLYSAFFVTCTAGNCHVRRPVTSPLVSRLCKNMHSVTDAIRSICKHAFEHETERESLYYYKYASCTRENLIWITTRSSPVLGRMSRSRKWKKSHSICRRFPRRMNPNVVFISPISTARTWFQSKLSHLQIVRKTFLWVDRGTFWIILQHLGS